MRIKAASSSQSINQVQLRTAVNESPNGERVVVAPAKPTRNLSQFQVEKVLVN